MSVEELFCEVDDFCQVFILDWQRQQLSSGERKRRRDCRLTPSEMMTIIVYFHQSQYRNFKALQTRAGPRVARRKGLPRPNGEGTPRWAT